MGISTDAIIAFGIDFGEFDFPRDFNGEIDDPSLEAWLCHVLGAPEAIVRDSFVNETFLRAKGIHIIHHCHCDAVMIFLSVPDTWLCASRGHPKRVPDLTPPAEGRIKIFNDSVDKIVEAFCKAESIDSKEFWETRLGPAWKVGGGDHARPIPGWHLFSFWC